MNLTRILALIAVGLVVLGMFLPWSVYWMTDSDNRPTAIMTWGPQTINAYLFGFLILPFGIAAMIGAKKEPPGLKSSIVMAVSALPICLFALFFVVGFAPAIPGRGHFWGLRPNPSGCFVKLQPEQMSLI